MVVLDVEYLVKKNILLRKQNLGYRWDYEIEYIILGSLEKVGSAIASRKKKNRSK